MTTNSEETEFYRNNNCQHVNNEHKSSSVKRLNVECNESVVKLLKSVMINITESAKNVKHILMQSQIGSEI